MIRETSLKTYEEISQAGFKDSWKETAYNGVKDTPLMTAREYFEFIITDGKREQIFPRLTELKKEGYIIEVGKRKCSVSGKLVYVLATLESAERLILKKLKFKELIKNLFVYKEDNIYLYQDFRKGHRKSYALTESRDIRDYKRLEIHIKFKEELNNLLNLG